MPGKRRHRNLPGAARAAGHWAMDLWRRLSPPGYPPPSLGPSNSGPATSFPNPSMLSWSATACASCCRATGWWGSCARARAQLGIVPEILAGLCSWDWITAGEELKLSAEGARLFGRADLRVPLGTLLAQIPDEDRSRVERPLPPHGGTGNPSPRPPGSTGRRHPALSAQPGSGRRSAERRRIRPQRYLPGHQRPPPGRGEGSPSRPSRSAHRSAQPSAVQRAAHLHPRLRPAESTPAGPAAPQFRSRLVLPPATRPSAAGPSMS